MWAFQAAFKLIWAEFIAYSTFMLASTFCKGHIPLILYIVFCMCVRDFIKDGSYLSDYK